MTPVSDETVTSTIASIYDAALSPDSWPRVLQDMARLFRCHFVDLFGRSHDRRFYAGIAHGLDRTDYQDTFLDTWFPRNVWGLSRPTRFEGEILTTREMLDPAVLQASEIYADFLGPRDLHEGLRLSLHVDRDGIEDMSLLRSWADGPFGADELDLAARLLPHLQRAAAVTRRVAKQDAASTAGLMGLTAAGLGAVLFDAAGRPVLLNAIAERLVAACDGLLQRDGEIQAASRAAQPALRHALRRAIGGASVARTSTTFRLPRQKRRPLIAVVLPLMGSTGWPLAQPPAALMLVSDGAAQAHTATQLEDLFGLTGAEAELAIQLDAGLDLREIADQRGRSVHTLRNQLSHLMAKTDTRTQAELARLLRSIPGGSDGATTVSPAISGAPRIALARSAP